MKAVDKLMAWDQFKNSPRYEGLLGCIDRIDAMAGSFMAGCNAACQPTCELNTFDTSPVSQKELDELFDFNIPDTVYALVCRDADPSMSVAELRGRIRELAPKKYTQSVMDKANRILRLCMRDSSIGALRTVMKEGEPYPRVVLALRDAIADIIK